jgi:hypothetical protein
VITQWSPGIESLVQLDVMHEAGRLHFDLKSFGFSQLGQPTDGRAILESAMNNQSGAIVPDLGHGLA